MSETYQSLSHSKWDCKYHVVFVPKRRRKAIFGQTRRQLAAIFHALARQKECQILGAVHKKQLLTYLRLANKRLGLLINFNVVLIKDGISRIVNGLEDDSHAKTPSR